jgi:hypothetical protein
VSGKKKSGNAKCKMNNYNHQLAVKKKKEEKDADQRTTVGKIQETLGRRLEDAPFL